MTVFDHPTPGPEEFFLSTLDDRPFQRPVRSIAIMCRRSSWVRVRRRGEQIWYERPALGRTP